MKHQTQLLSLFGVVSALTLNATNLSAADAKPAPASDAEVLLNLFQEKGMISPQEAEKARTELAKRSAQSAEEFSKQSKVHFAKWIEGIDLYGDARLRFETRGGENGAVAGDDRMERNRWRYRLRAGAKMEFTDNLRAGHSA